MKKLLFLNWLLLGLLVAPLMTSCDDDDKEEEKPEPTGKYTFNSGLQSSATVDVSGWDWKDAELNGETATEELAGEITTDKTLDAAVNYKLSGSCIVKDGATLTIPAGTQIEVIKEQGTEATSVYIAVMMGSKIMINGTADMPVLMSSTNAVAGEWGGLTICGKAVTTAGVNAEAEVGGFKYGGTDKADNSGSVKYLVIKGTGASINSESQYNGVSLYAVGSATTFENIAVINGADDGIEFFGGSAKVKNIYLVDNEDDAVDWTEGWDGEVENTYIKHNIEGFSTAFEADKDNNNPMFKNVTCISATGGTALQFKKTSGATITGLYIDGYDVELDMKDLGPTENVIVEGNPADVKEIPAE